MPKHPVDDLTFRSGDLTFRYGGADGPAPYLDTPSIEIVDKDGHRDMPSSNDVAYVFTLSAKPDETWREFFDGSNKDVKAHVIGQRLELYSIPANLVSHYNKAKAAVDRANEIYSGHKKALIETVKELDLRRDREKQAKETREQTIRDQFNDLQL